ncbi:helix-turn-helix domain-containing protein [Clostridium sp.]
MINTFGDLVSSKRKQKEMSLNSVAKEAELDVAYISKIEKNVTKQPSYLSVSKISSVLNITTEELSQVFDVAEIKSSSYKIQDSNIERKMVLTEINNTIIQNSDFLSEETIETTIQVLNELKRISLDNKKRAKYIIFIIQNGGEEIIIESNKYDYNVKEFIEDVYREKIVAVVEIKSIEFTNSPIISIEECINFAKEIGYIDKEEIIKFQAYIKK